MRPSGRTPDQLREMRFDCTTNRYAEGACLIHMGHTQVLCTASVEDRLPPFMKKGCGQGWITAEYGMLPRATHTRGAREAARGKQSGRTQEIQRLIGRSLRAVADLRALGERTVTIDCDVLQADGGTRCASITGAYVALHLATAKLAAAGEIADNPLTAEVAAISCGLYQGAAVLDLDYEEDSACQADVNFVMTGDGRLIEIQGTAEEHPFTDAEFDRLRALARGGIRTLAEAQRRAIAEALPAMAMKKTA